MSMMNRNRSLLFLLALAPVAPAVMTACGDDDEGEEDTAGPADVAVPSLSWSPDCPGGFAGAGHECARFDAPLDYSQPKGKTVSVFVTRRKADGDPKGQIWFLQGGPGGSGADIADYLDRFHERTPGYDTFVLEHRGVGQSTPMECPKFKASLGVPANENWQPEEPAQITDCLDEFRGVWGDDGVRGFSTTNAANDLALAIRAVKEAGGAGEKVIVYGVSYGTYWAHRYLQLYPDQPSALVLDSISPPGDLFSTTDRSFDSAGEEFLKACAADGFCAGKLTDDPKGFLNEVYAQLDAGQCNDIGTRQDVRQAFSQLLTSWSNRVLIAPLAYRLARCSGADQTALASATEAVNRGEEVAVAAAAARPNRPTRRGDGINNLLYYNVILSELWDGRTTDDGLAQYIAGSLFAPGGQDTGVALYDAWPRYTEPLAAQFAQSSVPMLMMNGIIDPQTPVANARVMKAKFAGPNQHFVEIPYAAHALLDASPVTTDGAPDCGQQVMENFVADPDNLGRAPDTSCLDDLRKPQFDLPEEIAQQFFGTGDAYDGVAVAATHGVRKPVWPKRTRPNAR